MIGKQTKNVSIQEIRHNTMEQLSEVVEKKAFMSSLNIYPEWVEGGGGGVTPLPLPFFSSCSVDISFTDDVHIGGFFYANNAGRNARLRDSYSETGNLGNQETLPGFLRSAKPSNLN
jgi:hypothetical protein